METVTISMTCLFVFTLVIAFVGLAISVSALLMFLHMRRRLFELLITQENMIDDLQRFSERVEDSFKEVHIDNNEILCDVHTLSVNMTSSFYDSEEWETEPVEQVEMKPRKRYKPMRKI